MTLLSFYSVLHRFFIAAVNKNQYAKTKKGSGCCLNKALLSFKWVVLAIVGLSFNGRLPYYMSQS